MSWKGHFGATLWLQQLPPRLPANPCVCRRLDVVWRIEHCTPPHRYPRALHDRVVVDEPVACDERLVLAEDPAELVKDILWVGAGVWATEPEELTLLSRNELKAKIVRYI